MANPIFSYRNLQSLIIVIFILSLINQLFSQFFHPYGLDSWQISEFLINYEAGFVRRGLFGQILYHLVSISGLDVVWILKLFSLTLYVLVSLFFVHKFRKNNFSLTILPLCFFLGGPILGDFWLRKDLLMICSLILIFYLIRSKKLNYISKIVAINLLLIPTFLTHEVFLFFSLPILVLIFGSLLKVKSNLISILVSAICFLPSILTFLIVVKYNGSIEIAQSIWDTWQNVLNGPQSNISELPPNALSSLGWEGYSTMKFHFSGNFLQVDNGIISSVIWIIIFPVVYLISTELPWHNQEKGQESIIIQKNDLSTVLVFQFFCLLPVFFFLSWDYMRVFFYWITSSYVIFVLIPPKTLKSIYPPFFVKWTNKINIFLHSFLSPEKTSMFTLVLFVGVSEFSFTLDRYVNSTMIYQVLSIISKPLIYFKDLII